MLTNENIWQLIDHITRKELRGNVVPADKRELLLQVANHKFYEYLLQQYEQTKKISKSLARFRVKKGGGELNTEQIVNRIFIQLPEDFGYLSSVGYNHTIYGYRPITELTDDQWYPRLASEISLPSSRNPVTRLLDHEEQSGSDYRYWLEVAGGLSNIPNITITYLRLPKTPTYKFTYDSTTDEYTYNSDNVELDWRDEDKIRIAGVILADMGIVLNDQQVFQYAKTVEAEQ